MHNLERIDMNRNGLMLYRCLNEGCGEEVHVPLAGSRAWRDNPHHRARNTILKDGRLRRLELAEVCPAAPDGIDPLRTLKRRGRRNNRYKVRTLYAV